MLLQTFSQDVGTILNTANSGGVVGGVKLFAGIATFISVVWHIWNVWLTPNESIDPKALRNPILILIFITFYGTFMGMIDGMLGLLNSSVSSATHATSGTLNLNESFNEVVNVYADDYINGRKNDVTTDPNSEAVIQEVLQESEHSSSNLSIWNGLDTFLATFSEGLGDMIFLSVVSWLSKVVLSVFNVIRMVILHILFIIGPMAAAISLIPGMASSFTKWFGAYINVTLWLAIAVIIHGMLFMSAKHFVDTSGGELMAVIHQISIVLCYLFIPKIAGYIVDSGGSALGGIVDRGYSKSKRTADSAGKVVSDIVNNKK